MNERVKTAVEVARPSVPLMSERRVSLIGAMFVVIGPITMALYTPAMTEIVKAFGTTESVVKMTLALYFAGFALGQLFAGPVSDALGRRPVTIGFMAVYLAASMVALFAPSIGVLLVARFIQGFGASAGVAIARAIVRDLFAHEASSRIMNLIGIILAIGPALAPTIGGLTMEVAGWRAIFVIMAGFGLAVVATALLALKETVDADPARLNPLALLRSYATLVTSGRFMTVSLALGASIGAIYAQATFLPFIMMDRVGLSPAEFGLSMMCQSGSFFAGALAVRRLMRSYSAYSLVPAGLALIAIGSAGTLLLNFWEPDFARVMVPVAFYAFGIAFVMPALSTAVLAPFPRMAGAAAALSGFMQMGSGLLVGSIGALMGDPVQAMGLLIPAMGAVAIASYAAYRRHSHAGEAEPRADVIASMPAGRTMLDKNPDP